MVIPLLLYVAKGYLHTSEKEVAKKQAIEWFNKNYMIARTNFQPFFLVKLITQFHIN